MKTTRGLHRTGKAPDLHGATTQMNAGKFHALAASLRLPNLPSVWCNTLTGILIALLAHGWSLPLLIPVLATATCLYLAGNLLNDWADRHWDATHRPERALPRGLFSPHTYLSLAIGLIILGWAAAGVAGISTLIISIALTGTIVIYTWLHKRSAWSVIPMALCRALLPVLGFSAISTHQGAPAYALLGGVSAALFLYLIMLSLSARSESAPQRKPPAILRLGFLLPPAALIGWSLQAFDSWGWLLSLIGMLPYLAWTTITLTLLRKPVPRLVSGLLAGIPLVDAMILIPAALSSSGFGGSLMWLWLPAFMLGRLLQRFVPAT